MIRLKSKKFIKTRYSGVLVSDRVLRINSDFYTSRSNISDLEQRLWHFAILKKNGNRLIRLTYDMDWRFETSRNSNVSTIVITRRDETEAYNDTDGMNGEYVIWNSTDRKGIVIEITEDGIIPLINWSRAKPMPVEPYLGSISVTITGSVNKEIELIIYEEIDGEIAEEPFLQKTGGARAQTRLNSAPIVTAVTNPVISDSFIVGKREMVLFGELVILDESDPPKTKQLNSGNSFSLSSSNKEISFNVALSSFTNFTGPIVILANPLTGKKEKAPGLTNSEESSELDKAKQRLSELERVRNEQESRLTTLTEQTERDKTSIRQSRKRQESLERQKIEAEERASSIAQREREAIEKLEEESSKNKTLMIAFGSIVLIGGLYYYKKVYLPSKLRNQ